MSTTTTPAPTSTTTRLHGLDALRAGALLLGIVLHSLMPFMPGFDWLVPDSQRSLAAVFAIGAIHLFRMVTFMMLAGFFGRMVLHRRGTRAYLADRTKRIALPFVVFWPLVVAPLGLIAAWDASLRGRTLPEGGDFVVGQLWFLVVLYEVALAWVALRWAAHRLLGAPRVATVVAGAGRLLSGRGGVLLATLPYVAGLALQGGTPTAGMSPPDSLVPHLPSLLTYGGAFAVGWCLHAAPDAITRIAASWRPLVAGALVGLVGWLLGGAPGLPAAVGFAATALAGWLCTYALLAVCVTFVRDERPWVQYLADASYWMYLLHLPVLVLVEVPLAPLGWPIVVKLLVTWAVTSGVLLGTYQLVVRGTWVGAWLNGRRYPAARASARA